jgi:RNA polymerase primary sigma factor
MVEAVTVDPDEQEEEPDPVSRVVALSLDWSQGGRLDRNIFNQILEEVHLPARHYRELQVALESAGVRLYDSDAPSDPDEADGDLGWNGSGFAEFLKRSSHRILTPGEEIALADRIDRGRLAQMALDARTDLPFEHRRDLVGLSLDGRRAAEEFVRHNVRLVIHNAKRFSRRLSGGLDFEDLVQEGYFGLARAVDKFDASKGFKFSTYATWWIRQSLERAVADKGRTIRVPVHYHEQITALWRAEQTIVAEGEEPTTEAVASLMGIPAKRAAEIRRIALHPSSLDAPVLEGGATRGDLIGDMAIRPVEQQIEAAAFRDEVADMLTEGLNDRERLVVQRRFGLGGHDPETLETIGKDLGVTRERIRQIESKALAKLQNSDRAANLRTFFERD